MTRKTKAPAQLQREIDQALASRQLRLEALQEQPARGFPKTQATVKTSGPIRLPDAAAKETNKNVTIMKAFNSKVEKLLDQAGAALHHALSPDHRQFVLKTKAGPLFVTPRGNWVATRFNDPEAAVKLVGTNNLNTYSGKWNHNYFDWPVNEALSNVAHWLKKVAV